MCPVNGSDVLFGASPLPINGAAWYSDGDPTGRYQRQASRASCTYQCVLTRVGRMWNIANGMKQPETHGAARVMHDRALTCARTRAAFVRTYNLVYTPRRGCASAGV